MDGRKTEIPEKVELPVDSDAGKVPVEPDPALADVLEQVVSATNSSIEASPRDLALRRRFESVATRLAGQELTVDPVLVSLLDAVNGRFRFLTAQEKSAMNLAVARTLYDDSASRVRLERLWHSLRGRISQ